MKRLVIHDQQLQFPETLSSGRGLTELLLPVLVGLGLGVLIVFAQGLPTKWMGLILLTVPVITILIAINDLEKSLMAIILLAVPLNLDVSVMISPYVDRVIALSELRVSLVTLALFVAYALWLTRKPWANGFSRLRFFGSVSLPGVCLIFAMIISLFQSTDTQLSLFQIAQYLELFLAYFYVANHVRDIEDLQFAVKVMMLGVLAESLLMLLQWATGAQFNIAGVNALVQTSGFADQQARVAGTLGGPNAAARYLAAHLPIIAALIFASSRIKEKLMGLLTFLMGAIAIVGTFSRSAWGGLLFPMLFFMLLGLWRGWVKARHAILIVVVFAILITATYSPVSYRLTSDDRGSAESRSRLASLAWEVIEARPIWGVGANNYALVAGRYATPKQGSMGSLLRQPVHNKYLLVWAETGLIGFLSFVWLLLASLWQATLSSKSDNRFLSLAATGFASALVSMIVVMFAQHGLDRASNLYFWLFPALIVSANTISETDQRR